MKLISVPQKYNTACHCHPEYESGDFLVTDVSTVDGIVAVAGKANADHQGCYEHYVINASPEVLEAFSVWHADDEPPPEWVEITGSALIRAKADEIEGEYKAQRERDAAARKDREARDREQRERSELARLQAKFGLPERDVGA